MQATWPMAAGEDKPGDERSRRRINAHPIRRNAAQSAFRPALTLGKALTQVGRARRLADATRDSSAVGSFESKSPTTRPRSTRASRSLWEMLSPLPSGSEFGLAA